MPSRNDADDSQPLTTGAPVVSNTTPLITLAELGLIEVLRSLYTEVWIPEAVMAEYELGRASHPLRPDLTPLPWMHVRPISAPLQLPSSLDAGERDAIALAHAAQASRILLDERAARAVAVRLGLTVTGSVGVLLAAKRRGFIAFVQPHLDKMLEQGRFISPTLYDHIVRQAGE